LVYQYKEEEQEEHVSGVEEKRMAQRRFGGEPEGNKEVKVKLTKQKQCEIKSSCWEKKRFRTLLKVVMNFRFP
jgi:hypothetical protein